MNIESIYRRIFTAGAAGTAFGYLLALRFDSWWWLFATVPVTLALYGPRETKEVLVKIAAAIGENFRRASSMKERTEALWQAGEKLAGAIKVLLKVLAVGGAILAGAVFNARLLFFLMHPSKGDVLGDLVATSLLTIAVGGTFLLAVAGVAEWLDNREEKVLLFPILKQSVLNLLESNCCQKICGGLLTFAGENLSTLFNDKRTCDWRGPDEKILRLGRLSRLLGTFLFLAAWPVIPALIILFTVLNSALAVVDVVLTVLLALSTSGSVAAVIGACLGAGSEYFLYPTFRFATGDVLRFAAFMAIGGLAGCGIYALRQFLLRLDKPTLRAVV